jgi:thymidylate synthase (FAD)
MQQEAVRLISVTPKAEEIMAYCARVSNPVHQDNPEFSRLINYCIKHGHWSIFEQANMILEVTTSRGVAPQILRHRSFSFQEFSQRYAEVDGFVEYGARRQDDKNRQNSLDDLDRETQEWFAKMQQETWDANFSRYKAALDKGIAKECARTLLPLGTSTRLYMNGTIRSWIHYIQLRTEVGTQLEHRIIAEQCRKIFAQQLPLVAAALGWA